MRGLPRGGTFAAIGAQDRAKAAAAAAVAAEARSSDPAAHDAAFREIVNKFSDDAQGRLRGDLGFLRPGDPTHDRKIVTAGQVERSEQAGPLWPQ